MLKKLDVHKLDVRFDGLILTFSPDTKIEPEKVIQWLENRSEKFQFLSDKKIKMETGTQNSLEALSTGKKILGTFISSL